MFRLWQEPGGERCDCGCQQPTIQQCSGGCDSCGSSSSSVTLSCTPPTPPPPPPPPPPSPKIVEPPKYDVVTTPPWTKAIIAGSQHYIATIGTTVAVSTILVRGMGGSNVEKAELINSYLFIAGFNTLFQAWFGTRLPVVMGSSLSSIIPTLYITSSRRFSACTDPKLRFTHSMRAVQGAQIVSSLFQVLLGWSGLWKKYVRGLSPLSATPLLTETGLGLLAQGFSQLAQCIEVGLPELIIVILLSQYIPSIVKSTRIKFDEVAVPLSIFIVWIYAEVLTLAGVYDNRPLQTQTSCRTDRSGLINNTPWIRIPRPFQWGRPTFDAGDALVMIAASFVSTVESTGTFIVASRYGGATPMPPSVHSRGILWQGLGALLHGIFGTGSGSSASVESAGLLGLTGIGSLRVSEISAGFMILSSILGKPGALLASIPLPITAAVNCVLFAYVASAGLGLLQFCDLTTNRSKFILGFSLFMGLSVPQYFSGFQSMPTQNPVHTDSLWFNDAMQVIFSSPATVAAIVAFFLDSTFQRGEACCREDNGWLWWKNFKEFDADPRSKKNYSLPLISLDRIKSSLKFENVWKCLKELFEKIFESFLDNMWSQLWTYDPVIIQVKDIRSTFNLIAPVMKIY